MDRRRRHRILLAGALLLLLGGGLMLRPRITPLLAPLRATEHRVELTLAWPVLYGQASLAQWHTLAQRSERQAGGVRPGVGVTEPGAALPPFTAWQAQPVADRWARYTSPAWREVRLITRLSGGLVLSVILVLAGRLAGWPVLRGIWFVAALVLTQHPGRPGTSHGSARWATARELRRLAPRPGHADLHIGRVGRQRVAIREEAQYAHVLLVAPTGAGKTSGLILPNLLREPGTRSLLITDPKRELVRQTAPYLRSVYGDRQVQVLDFLDAELSAGYNPLASVTDTASADLFAQTWVANTGTSKEAFWDNAARTLIGAAALHLVQTEEVTPPLAALLDFLCGLSAEEVTEILAASPAPEVQRLARGFLTNLAKNERLVGSVFAELPPRFACLNLASVRRVTAVCELDLMRLATTPTVLYLALDLDYARTLAPLTACFFRDAFTTLAALAKAQLTGQLPVPALAYLDEFGTLGHIPDFAARLATVRAAHLGCVLVVQDLAQLTKTYGRADAETIRTNAATKLCLAGVTHDDAEYFSRLAGTTTVHATNRGSTHPLLLPWADRGNRGVGEVARPLITPDELRTLGEEVLIVAGRQHPVRARQMRAYQDPALRHRLADPIADDALAYFRRRRAARSLPLPDAAALAPMPSENHSQLVGQQPTAPRQPASGPAAPVWAAPTTVAAPRTTRVPGAPALRPAAPATPRFTPPQRAIVAALVAANRPGKQVSSTAIAQATGLARPVVRRELAEIRALLALEQWDDIAEAACERGLLVGQAPAISEHEPQAEPRTGVNTVPTAMRALTASEAALVRAIRAAPAATSTGWATALGVSPSRVRQLLGTLREQYGAPTTAALVARLRADSHADSHSGMDDEEGTGGGLAGV